MLSIKIWHQKLCWHKTWLKLALQLDVVCINSFYEDSYLLGFQNRTFKRLKFTFHGSRVEEGGREHATLNYCPWTVTHGLSEVQTHHYKCCAKNNGPAFLSPPWSGWAFLTTVLQNNCFFIIFKQKNGMFFITLYSLPSKP